jgi:adenine phosphoribosyltransferase
VSEATEQGAVGTGTDGVADLVLRGVRDIPDFPRPGIVFKDITPLLSNGPALASVVRDIAGRADGIDLVAGIEARGFIFGAAVAHELGIGFLPVRKEGKLPGDTVAETYDLEYGNATIEIHAGDVPRGTRVLLVDDILATGGTALAAWELLERVGAEVVRFEAVLELGFLNGRARLGERETHVLLRV